MKEIKLTKGKVALVDDEDFEYLNQWKWQCSKGYATRHVRKNNKHTYPRMHRILLNVPDGMLTDHINHNKLDNRKCNLRICSNSQNIANSRRRKDNNSGYKGVYFDRKKWRASIRCNGVLIHLGMFDDKESAFRSYVNKARELFGEFANSE